MILRVIDPNRGVKTLKVDQIVICADNGTPIAMSVTFGCGVKFLTAEDGVEFNEQLGKLGLQPVQSVPLDLGAPPR